jgi:hypothetical protein
VLLYRFLRVAGAGVHVEVIPERLVEAVNNQPPLPVRRGVSCIMYPQEIVLELTPHVYGAASSRRVSEGLHEKSISSCLSRGLWRFGGLVSRAIWSLR